MSDRYLRLCSIRSSGAFNYLHLYFEWSFYRHIMNNNIPNKKCSWLRNRFHKCNSVQGRKIAVTALRIWSTMFPQMVLRLSRLERLLPKTSRFPQRKPVSQQIEKKYFVARAWCSLGRQCFLVCAPLHGDLHGCETVFPQTGRNDMYCSNKCLLIIYYIAWYRTSGKSKIKRIICECFEE
jgi:hypothetical protein